jgi:hypothetical protein
MLSKALRLCVSAVSLLVGATAAGQLPVSVAPGVDTTAAAPRAILARWRDYLRDRPDSARPNGHWARDEQARWPSTDLTASWIYAPAVGRQRGLDATVVDLAPAAAGDTTTYVVRTLFMRRDSATGTARPAALARVYAVREDGRWVLANALPRLTRDWRRVRAGHVEFVYEPGRTPDSTRAARAAAFVDSAAGALGVTLPPTIGSYLTTAPREVARILGLDLGFSPNTGRVYAEDALVVAGQRTVTEWNTHDLAHVVLAPIAATATRYWSEGAATWVGGRGGRDFATLVRELDADLAHNPGRTLDSILAPHAWKDSISVPAAAVLVRMAFEHGGTRAVARLVASPDESPEGIRRAGAAALAVKPEALGTLWRRAVARLAGGG